MKRLVDDVAAFHRAMGVPVLEAPGIPADDRVRLRALLLEEECREVLSAMFQDWQPGGDCAGALVAVDLPGVADGLADLIYVAVGAALEFGIPLERVWNEVQRANLAKVGPDGFVRKRADGKVLKPADWRPPDIETALFGTSTRGSNANESSDERAREIHEPLLTEPNIEIAR